MKGIISLPTCIFVPIQSSRVLWSRIQNIMLVTSYHQSYSNIQEVCWGEAGIKHKTHNGSSIPWNKIFGHKINMVDYRSRLAAFSKWWLQGYRVFFWGDLKDFTSEVWNVPWGWENGTVDNSVCCEKRRLWVPIPGPHMKSQAWPYMLVETGGSQEHSGHLA